MYTRDHIVATAAATFASRGFRATTIRDIAERAEVNEITVYRHFSTKMDLYKCAMGWKLENACLSDQLRAAIETGEVSIANLRQVLVLLVEALLDNRDLSRLLTFTMLEFGPEAQFAAEFRRALESLLTYMAECQRMGIIDQGECEQAVAALIAMTAGHFTYSNVLASQECVWNARHYAGAYVDVWLLGVLKTAPTPLG